MKIRLIQALFTCGIIAGAIPCLAQKSIIVNVYPELDIHSISPFIYGSNGQSDDRDENITVRRVGGNRLTGYNWENNASNAGTDYINHSDDYLTYISGIAGADAKKPGIVITAFHDTSLAMKCYSLVTLQAAGYVAVDFNGTVSQAETAPSARWNKVLFAKGSQFSLSPDLNDGIVSMEEEVNLLVDKFGQANESRGIRGYEIDNEPALWPSTHPRIHPNQPTVAEYISKSSSLSKAVKAVDPTAEIFGGVMFGYSEYLNFQNAPDWNSYKSKYGTYINAYLSNMKDSSDKAGKRLLDVLDLHWYPEAQGPDKSGKLVRITQSPNVDSGVAAAREQAPRSLWDSSYKENSWIGQYYSPVALLPMLGASIAKYNSGTKLAFTEINYGGDTSISGAIAMADVFGLFGKYGVYMSNYWGALQSYVAAAYKIYRNYDGNKSTFGDLCCKATASDPSAASVYASLDSHDSTKLHLIIINKAFIEQSSINITINSKKQFGTAHNYALYSSSPNIFHPKVLYTFTNNALTFTADPQSIHHFVVSIKPNSDVATLEETNALECTNNLTGNISTIHYHVSSPASIRIIDMQGRMIKQYEGLNGLGTLEFSGTSGVYEVLLNDGQYNERGKIVIVR